jgi:hypothetical protein
MAWSKSSAIIDCWGQTPARQTIWAAVCLSSSFPCDLDYTGCQLDRYGVSCVKIVLLVETGVELFLLAEHRLISVAFDMRGYRENKSPTKSFCIGSRALVGAFGQ